MQHLRTFLLVLLLAAGVSLAAFLQVHSQGNPVCGNGVPEQGEDCDDGNHTVADSCDTFGEAPNSNGICTPTFCGDGALQQPNGAAAWEWCDQSPGYCALDPVTPCSSDGQCAIGSCTLPCAGSCGAKLMGWAWADTFGWLSLNDQNCDYLGGGLDPNTCQHLCDGTTTVCDQDDPGACGGDPSQCRRVKYYTQLTADPSAPGSAQVRGFAWSDTIGWVCFGPDCQGTSGAVPGRCSQSNILCDPAAPACPGAETCVAGWFTRVLDEGKPSNVVIGWAKAPSLQDNGWISLSCRNQFVCAPNDDQAGSVCDSSTGAPCSGGASACGNFCVPDNTAGYSLQLYQKEFHPTGEYGGRCQGTADVCDPTALTCTDGSGSCSTVGAACGTSGTCQDSCSPSRCQQHVCSNTGVGCDPAVAGACPGGTCIALAHTWPTLQGYTWSDTTDGNGLGWLEFNPVATLRPFLQTQRGDIYSLRGLRGDAPPPAYNATFLILSGGDIQNFISAGGSIENFGQIGFLSPETRYSNILGRLDVDGLSCTPVGSCSNVYGTPVVAFTPASFGLNPLGGKIYYFNGDVTLSQAISVLNGSEFFSGAGTVIINGNLTITQNIAYQSSVSGITRFRNLGSLAWIVKGDLRIAPTVTQLAGNFIVLGDGQSSCDTAATTVGPERCGQIFSCYDPATGRQSGAACAAQLKVSGLMMSRKFFFDRSFQSKTEGAEIIIYDGRLLTNTPPGLEDFAQALPRFGQNLFTR